MATSEFASLLGRTLISGTGRWSPSESGTERPIDRRPAPTPTRTHMWKEGKSGNGRREIAPVNHRVETSWDPSHPTGQSARAATGVSSRA
jgi:hypothetical protein